MTPQLNAGIIAVGFNDRRESPVVVSAQANDISTTQVLQIFSDAFQLRPRDMDGRDDEPAPVAPIPFFKAVH